MTEDTRTLPSGVDAFGEEMIAKLHAVQYQDHIPILVSVCLNSPLTPERIWDLLPTVRSSDIGLSDEELWLLIGQMLCCGYSLFSVERIIRSLQCREDFEKLMSEFK